MLTYKIIYKKKPTYSERQEQYPVSIRVNKSISNNKCYHPLLNLSRVVNVLLKDVTFKTLSSIVEVMMTQRYFTLMPRFNFLNIFSHKSLKFDKHV